MPVPLYLPPSVLLCSAPVPQAIGTPMLYFNASHDANFGASLPQGPWDTARAHGKLWVTEDDQRTSFGQQAKGACGWDWGTGSHSCGFQRSAGLFGACGTQLFVDFSRKTPPKQGGAWDSRSRTLRI